jgi:hypothetical protein
MVTPGDGSVSHLHDAGHSPLELAGGSAALVGATLAAAALFPASHQQGRLLLVAVAVGVCAAVLADARTCLAVAGLGYLLFVGFLANSHGELSWDGADSVWHLFVLAMAAGLGRTQRWLRAVQADAEFDAALHRLLDEAGPDQTGGRHPSG